jgi:hypothetical protein
MANSVTVRTLGNTARLLEVFEVVLGMRPGTLQAGVETAKAFTRQSPALAGGRYASARLA